MKIYKSNFSAEELATWEALIAKGKVAPEDNEEEMLEDKPAFPPKKPAQKAVCNTKKPAQKADVEEDVVETQKSASPEITAALERMEKLEKSIEMKEFTEIAKKYAPLGEKEEELAERLYEMKKSNPSNYDAYVSILDKSLGMVEKSGLFAEIGKSHYGSTAGGAVGKAEAKAKEIMKADPNMSYDAAIAKAWEDPALMAEYDSEYQK